MAKKADQNGKLRISLRRERVLKTAIGLADESGIPSLSMRKLGEALARSGDPAGADGVLREALDLTMPRMDGEEAFREMRLLDPDAKIILCSGYSEKEATDRFADEGLAGFLQKPYSMSALKGKLREALPEARAIDEERGTQDVE